MNTIITITTIMVMMQMKYLIPSVLKQSIHIQKKKSEKLFLILMKTSSVPRVLSHVQMDGCSSTMYQVIQTSVKDLLPIQV